MFIVKCMYEDYDSDFCNFVVFNCAEAHTKLEGYGSAIQDATKAIEVDPKYSKGYYRRSAAYLAMGKFKKALKYFQQVKRICPNDPDATKKLKECEKVVMKLKFQEAISVPESERHSVADSIDYRTISGSVTTRGNVFNHKFTSRESRNFKGAQPRDDVSSGINEVREAWESQRKSKKTFK